MSGVKSTLFLEERMLRKLPLYKSSTESAHSIREPLTPPRRPLNAPTRRISVTLDLDRYVAFRTFAATQGLTGEEVALIALDRLLAD